MPLSRALLMTATPTSRGIRSKVRQEPSERLETLIPDPPSGRRDGLAMQPLATYPGRGDKRDARSVDEVRIGRRVEQDGVGAASRRQQAQVAAAQSAGSSDSRRQQRLLDRHVQVADRQRDAE